MSRHQVMGQLDLFAKQEEADKAARMAAAPCIYDSPARGLTAREAEFDDWCRTYDNFDSYARSHAWRPGMAPPVDPPGRCQVWTLTASAQPNSQCGGHSDRRYKGTCLGCDWEGPARGDKNEAAEDACDHAWPGWRDQPVMPHMPYADKPLANWLKEARRLYPPGWVDAGGPIRTRRPSGGPHYAHEWNGFDMCGGVENPPAREETK
jgi:hypothetical protein